MSIKIALAGNPNCGKTTMFNALTGSSQYVGDLRPASRWKKKEGRLKGNRDVIIQDLPGVSIHCPPIPWKRWWPGTIWCRSGPTSVLNIVDGTNMERNLYLTTPAHRTGHPGGGGGEHDGPGPRKNGDQIDLEKLGSALGCQVVAISALKGEGAMAAAEAAVALAGRTGARSLCMYSPAVWSMPSPTSRNPSPAWWRERYHRWYAIKLFERDEKVVEQLSLTRELKEHLEAHIADCEQELDDDAESIITNQRYTYIGAMVDRAVKKKRAAHAMSTSDRIDRVVTNRILALPIFVAVMVLVYAISMGGWRIYCGYRLTDWANDGLFGDGWFLPLPPMWMPGMRIPLPLRRPPP